MSGSSSTGHGNAVSGLNSGDSLDDSLIDSVVESPEAHSSNSNSTSGVAKKSNFSGGKKSSGIRSETTSPEPPNQSISKSARVSSLVCLGSLDKQQQLTSPSSLPLSVNTSTNKMTSTASTRHHDIDLLRSTRSRLTIVSSSVDFYQFPPNSPVSFNVRDLKEDMDILTISRTDNPYLAAKLDLLSETAERSLLVSPCSAVGSSNVNSQANGSSSNISTNNSSVSRQSAIQLHPLLQSRMSSCDRSRGKDSFSLASEANAIDQEVDENDLDDGDDGQESSELLLINRSTDTDDGQNTFGGHGGRGSLVRTTTAADSVDISLDNILEDTSNLHEIMIRSPPPQFPTKLSSFIFPDANPISPMNSSPARSVNQGAVNSPVSGHRSVLGWRGRYPPIEKASSDTSAVLSPRLLLAAAGLGSKDGSKSHSTSKASHSSTSNILSSNMVPLHIRRLTRRASSGCSRESQEKTSASSPLIASTGTNVKNNSSISTKIKSHTNILLSPLINSSHRASSGPTILSNEGKECTSKYQNESSDTPGSFSGHPRCDKMDEFKVSSSSSGKFHPSDVDVKMSQDVPVSIDGQGSSTCEMIASSSSEALIPPATVSSASSDVTIESTSTVLTE